MSSARQLGFRERISCLLIRNCTVALETIQLLILTNSKIFLLTVCIILWSCMYGEKMNSWFFCRLRKGWGILLFLSSTQIIKRKENNESFHTIKTKYTKKRVYQWASVPWNVLLIENWTPISSMTTSPRILDQCGGPCGWTGVEFDGTVQVTGLSFIATNINPPPSVCISHQTCSRENLHEISFITSLSSGKLASLTIWSCYANISVFMDFKNNQFLKKWMMIVCQRSAESRGFSPGTPVSSHREGWWVG